MWLGTLAVLFGTALQPSHSSGGYQMPFGCGTTLMDDQTRQGALDLINRIRSSVALGEFQARKFLPSASDMVKLRWDCNLESIAHRVVQNCPSNMPQATGPNGLNYYYFAPGTSEPILRNATQSAMLQWIEVKSAPWPESNVFDGKPELRGFSNMVRGNTDAVGCSSSTCGNQASAACVFSQPDVQVGTLVYPPGEPCQSGGKCITTFPSFCEFGLCVITEGPYKTRKWPTRRTWPTTTLKTSSTTERRTWSTKTWRPTSTTTRSPWPTTTLKTTSTTQGRTWPTKTWRPTSTTEGRTWPTKTWRSTSTTEGRTWPTKTWRPTTTTEGRTWPTKTWRPTSTTTRSPWPTTTLKTTLTTERRTWPTKTWRPTSTTTRYPWPTTTLKTTSTTERRTWPTKTWRPTSTTTRYPWPTTTLKTTSTTERRTWPTTTTTSTKRTTRWGGMCTNTAISDAFRVKALRLHNDFRSLVARGMATNGERVNETAPPSARMSNLVYDCLAERYAYDHVRTCDRQPSPISSHPDYQENIRILETTSTDVLGAIQNAVETWTGELAVNGIPSNMVFTYELSLLQQRTVTHVTKIIWGTNRFVGCATQLCTGFYVTSCMYREPINVIGQNIYSIGSACSNCPGGVQYCKPTSGLCYS